MKFADLVDEIGKRSGENADDVKRVLDSLCMVFSKEIKKGKQVRFEKLGSFSVVHRSPRKSYFGKPVDGNGSVRSLKRIVLRPSKSFSENVNWRYKNLRNLLVIPASTPVFREEEPEGNLAAISNYRAEADLERIGDSYELEEVVEESIANFQKESVVDSAVATIENISHFEYENVQPTEEDRVMGNLNFQDEQSDKPQQKPQNQSAQENPDEPKVENIFVDEPNKGSTFLWVAIVVILIAGIGGGFYLLNRYGYLKLGQRKPAETTMSATAPVNTPAAEASKVTPPASPSKEFSKSSGKFAIQVSAFRTQHAADRYAGKLKKKGLDAYVLAGEVPKEGKWFKVCVGSYDTKLRAIAATEEMKRKVGTDVWVVPAQ